MNTKNTMDRIEGHLKGMTDIELLEEIEKLEALLSEKRAQPADSCGCIKASETAICDCDIEAARDDIRILQTWDIRKVRNLAGVLAGEDVYQALFAQLNKKQKELYSLHDGLFTMAYLYDPGNFENPEEVKELHQRISKALELTM